MQNLPQNKKKLLRRLADGHFHSGVTLASELKVSNSAICKLVSSLNFSQIVTIRAVNGKGYKLDRPLELIDKVLFFEKINQQTQALITDFELYDEIESTNSYLLAKAHENLAATGVICVAEKQTVGKGRRGRHWVSPFGCNLYFSILWKFETGPGSLSGLSLAVGVAVINALKLHNIEGVGLKWPNDIYWQYKKLGGILVEISGENEGPCSAVIGLGLNLSLDKQAAEGIDQDWIDLAQILGKEEAISRNALLVTLVEQLFMVITHYQQVGFGYYLEQWRDYDCMLGQSVNLMMGHQQIAGVVKGINEQGLLALQMDSGEIKHYASGEVSFKRA